MNIYQKLIEVRKSVHYLKKANTGGQYNYVSSSQVIAAIRDKMNEVGLLLVPNIDGAQVSKKVEAKKNGGETHTFFTELTMKYVWINADDPKERIEIPWYGQGVDIAGEKGVGKALTYAEKYLLLKQFNIPTDKDDPDSFQKKNAPNVGARQEVTPENKQWWNRAVEVYQNDKNFDRILKHADISEANMAKIKEDAEI